MARIENVNLSARHVLPVAFWFAEVEREVVFTPNHQQARLFLTHPGLPFRIGVHIGSVIIKQIALNIGLAGLVEKGKFIGPEVRIIAIHVRIVPDMARSRRLQREEICAKRAFVGSAIGPKGPPRLPIRP